MYDGRTREFKTCMKEWKLRAKENLNLQRQ